MSLFTEEAGSLSLRRSPLLENHLEYLHKRSIATEDRVYCHTMEKVSHSTTPLRGVTVRGVIQSVQEYNA